MCTHVDYKQGNIWWVGLSLTCGCSYIHHNGHPPPHYPLRKYKPFSQHLYTLITSPALVLTADSFFWTVVARFLSSPARKLQTSAFASLSASSIVLVVVVLGRQGTGLLLTGLPYTLFTELALTSGKNSPVCKKMCMNISPFSHFSWSFFILHQHSGNEYY